MRSSAMRAQLPNAKLRGHEIGARKRLAPAKRQAHLHGHAGGLGHAPGKTAHDTKFLLPLGYIDEPQLAHGTRVVALNETFHELRRVARASTYGRDLYTAHTALLLRSQRSHTACAPAHRTAFGNNKGTVVSGGALHVLSYAIPPSPPRTGSDVSGPPTHVRAGAPCPTTAWP